MKLGRFCMVCCCVTTLMVGYVHQQVSSVRIGYDIRAHRHELAQLVDRNEVLRYNLASVSAPMVLERQLRAQAHDLARPQRRARILLAKKQKSHTTQPEVATHSFANDFGSGIMNFFMGSAEAQAQTR